MKENFTEWRRAGLHFRECLDSWNLFLDTFGNLLPGGVGIYEIGDKVRPLYHSPGAMHLCHGFEESFYKTASKDLSPLLMKGERERLWKAIQTAVEQNEIFDCTLRYQRTPQSEGWIWVRGRICRGNFRRKLFAGILLDVTESKRIEQELKVQRKKYRILEETTNEILFEFLPGADELTYSYKEMGGDLVRRRISHYRKAVEENPMVHPDFQELFWHHLDIASQKKTEGQFEYLTKIAGRGFEWNRLHYSSIEDYGGKVYCIVGHIKNIHDEVLHRQKRREELQLDQTMQFGIQQGIQNRLRNADMEDRHFMAIVAILHFRKFTEQNGVAWGDAAMYKLNEVIREATESSAIMGNLGDGKVLMYMSNLSNSELDEKMCRILTVLKEDQVQVANIQLDCSIGASAKEGIVDYSAFFQEVEEALHIARITKGENYIRV